MNIKELAFSAYALVFNAAAKLPVKKNRVVLFSLYNANFRDALGQIELELARRSPKDGVHAKSHHQKYDVIRVDRNELFAGPLGILKFMTRDAWRMGRARFVFLNNNFFPMGKMVPNQKTQVLQVWHGMGAFKKFGYDMPQPDDVRKKEIGANRNLSYVVVSSPDVALFYMSAFGVTKEQIIDTGSPNQDWYFMPEATSDLAKKQKREAFEERYPKSKGKKKILYAPTFRDDSDADSILSHLDLKALKEAFDKGPFSDVCILIRMHPHDEASKADLKTLLMDPSLSEYVLDLSDYPDANELCFLADLLITDYSSICMNFALLDKPCLFYAYDLDNYKDGRNFYYDFESMVPGPVTRTMRELCDAAENGEFRDDKREAFRRFNFGDHVDGTATKKLLDRIL